MIVVSLDNDVKLRVVGDTGECQVGGADDGDTLFMALDGLSALIEDLAVVKDVGFGVYAALGVDLDLKPLLLD